MKKLQFSTTINAPKEKVWNAMLGNDSYPKWTDVFSPGSHYVGDWNTGSKILFLGPSETGGTGGMVSRIKESRLHEHVSIEILGFVENGIEDTTSEAAKGWAGSFENYTFKENNGTTDVLVELLGSDSAIGDISEMFGEIWPKALQKLKKLAEENQ